MSRGRQMPLWRVIALVLLLALIGGLGPQAAMCEALAEEPDAAAEEVDAGVDRAGTEADLDEAAEDSLLTAQSASVSDPRVVTDDSMAAGQVTTWDCVWLGSYPQTYVDDAALVAELDAATGWDDDGDLSYNGQTYRRLSESDATYSSDYSAWWDWSGKASPKGYCYFRWEPIKWRVLEVSGDTALVVADVALDNQKYSMPHPTNCSLDSTWETCFLRSWLNGYGTSSNKPEIDCTSDNFIDIAFSTSELGAIHTTQVTNANNLYYETTGGNNTIDRVFLLSESDVWYGESATRHGFVTVYDTCDEARRCKMSNYAHAMGAKIDTSDDYRNNCDWWLRSPGYRPSNAARVGMNGVADRSGDSVGVSNTVRPALTISLSSSALSYAGTVSSDGTLNTVGGDGTEDETEAALAEPVYGSFTTSYDDAPRTFSGEKGFVYKDAYFVHEATQYNHSLATMSVCMAFAAYGLKPYESYDVNIKDLMHQCGFTDDGRYKQYDFNEVPDTFSIGCAIGSKGIRVDGQDYTLIAVAVRGGGYEDEWSDNFNAGSSGDHEGFDRSAETIKSYIIDYIGENKIKGNVKIWITGFSRAGAVATHTAAKLNSLAGFAYEDESSESGYTRVDFDKESIYAYGFATPAGACKASNPHSSNYDNIWNVIEYNDPVPLLAPGEWGFDRYGTTKILPYREGCYDATFKAYIDRMRAKLNAGYGYNIEGFTNYLAFPVNSRDATNHGTQGTTLRKAMRALASVIGNRATYYDEYQREVMAFAEHNLGGEDKNPDFEVFLGSLIEDFVIVKLPQFAVLHPNLLATILGNVSTLAEVHADQEYYVGWMQLMDENYANSLPVVWGDPSFRIFKANCPVDLYVYNADGKMVASIVDDVPSTDEDQPVIVSIDENGQKVAYLPNGSDYKIMVVTREESDVSCGVEEVNAESGSTVRSTLFKTASLGEQETMEAEIPAIPKDEMENAANSGSSTQYSLDTDEDEVEIENDLRGAEAIAGRTYEVTTTSDETQGQVYGGGSFVEGSFARLEAVGTDQYYLEGFYVNGVRLKVTDTENPDVVRFKVTGDTVVEARFAPKTAVSAPTAASGLVYTGKAQEGVPAGEGYAVEDGTATNAGSHTATVTLGREYIWDDGSCEPLELGWTIEPAALTSVTWSGTSFTYTGKVQRPSVKSAAAGKIALKPSEYSVSYSNASSKAVATYKVTVTGKRNFTGSKTVSYKIVRATNKVTAAKTSVKKTFKATKLKKKATKVALPKVTAKFGTSKWKVTAKDRKGVLSLKGGKVQVKKGAKKGTYTIKLKATVAAAKNYKAATTKVVKVTVTVK